MDFSILKEIVNKNNYSIHDAFDNWEDAVKASVRPLIDNGYVKEEYAQKVVDMVKEYGPYICICPHVAIPHAMAPELVTSDSSVISFMKVNKPVVFSDKEIEHSELFFALATPDANAHLEELQILVTLLEQDGVVDALLNVKTKEDLLNLLDNK